MFNSIISGGLRSGINEIAQQFDKNNLPTRKDTSKDLEVTSSVVSLSPQAKLINISARYDVTNISNVDAAKLSIELRDGGFITPFEAANMSIAIVPLGSTFNPTAKRNLLEQFQTSLAYTHQGAAPEQITSLKNIVDILQTLKDSRSTAVTYGA